MPREHLDALYFRVQNDSFTALLSQGCSFCEHELQIKQSDEFVNLTDTSAGPVRLESRVAAKWALRCCGKTVGRQVLPHRDQYWELHYLKYFKTEPEEMAGMKGTIFRSLSCRLGSSCLNDQLQKALTSKFNFLRCLVFRQLQQSLSTSDGSWGALVTCVEELTDHPYVLSTNVCLYRLFIFLFLAESSIPKN